MNSTKLAKVFGIVLIVVGILGFIPGITSAEGMLLGIFQVGAVFNIIHILVGIIGLAMAGSAPKTYFKIFGVIYLIAAIVGFVQGTTVLGIFDVNMADNVLHLILAVVALWAGFGKGDEHTA